MPTSPRTQRVLGHQKDDFERKATRMLIEVAGNHLNTLGLRHGAELPGRWECVHRLWEDILES